MVNERTDREKARQNDRRPRLSRWRQITLRGMFGCVLLIGIAFGWGRHQHRCFLTELETATALAEKHEADLNLSQQPRSELPVWDIWEIKRGRLYDPITEVHFSVPATIDESAWNLLASLDYLDHLWIQESQLPESATFSPFSRLTKLWISKSPLRSEQFESIGSLYQLEELWLYDVGLNDNDARFIEHLTGLKSLKLSGNPLTDESTRYLRRLKNLQSLYLSDTATTGAVIEELTCHRSLKRLYLTGAAVRDEDLKTIPKFTYLEELSLAGTRITDAGVHWIASLENLQYLYLSDTDVGDESVKLLSASSSNLIRLDMEETRISEASVPLLLEMSSLRRELCMFGATDISEASLSRLSGEGDSVDEK